jgi:hypothetical protein
MARAYRKWHLGQLQQQAIMPNPTRLDNGGRPDNRAVWKWLGGLPYRHGSPHLLVAFHSE